MLKRKTKVEIIPKPKTHRVCLVLAYFGKWPPWISYFVESCRSNPRFTWLILTDIGDLPEKADNVLVRPMTLAIMKERTALTTGLDVCLEHTYKCCDLKPLYGKIFANELAEFDFWGYTDLDVVYGDLDKFVTDKILQECDVYTAAPRVLVGHFTLFRNTSTLAELFKKVPDCEKILGEYECQAFDEKAFAQEVERQAKQGQLRLHRADVQLDDLHFGWQKRKHYVVLRSQKKLWDIVQVRELAYFHFMQSKYLQGFCQTSIINTSIFAITEKGIQPIQGPASICRLAFSLVLSWISAIPWNCRRAAKKLLRKSQAD